jgi:hypothetical protein
MTRETSTEIMNLMKSLGAGPEDIIVRFDVISLFTLIPLGLALRLLNRHFGTTSFVFCDLF